jgi:serine phosphatase RsbU (regulator of sigma subunit)
MMPRTDTRWWLVIAGALLAILIARLIADDPSGLGIGLLAIGPIILAAYCFAHRGALITATAAMAVFVTTASDLEGMDLAIGSAMRALVFFGTGLLVAELLRRAAEQGALIAEQTSELSELRVLREALTPSEVPATPHLDVATAYVAAEGQVAGDFFLVMPDADGRAFLAIGDAVGHGVAAARRAAYVRAVLATLATSAGDPGRLLELANTALMESGAGSADFVTAICALVDDGRLTWSSAGHPSPWDLDTGAALPAPPPFEPLGLAREQRYETVTAQLPRGAGVLLYSDGLPEARHQGGAAGGRRLFGEAAAREQLLAHRGARPADVVGALRRAACEFAGGSLADDLCLLAVRRTQ